MKNSPTLALSLALLGALTTHAYAQQQGKPYVDSSKPFITIEDPNRQAEAWAMCAAAYDFTASIISKSAPARAKQLGDLANGAEAAVTMTIVADGLDDETTPEKFNALWSMGKLLGKELPESRKTTLAAELEAHSGERVSIFLANLTATVHTCMQNLEGQQAYIDMWRTLATSGMLKAPSE